METTSASILLAVGASPRSCASPIDNRHPPDVNCQKPILPLHSTRKVVRRLKRQTMTSGCLSSGARFRLGQAIATNLAVGNRPGTTPMQRAGHQRPLLDRAISAPPSEITIRILDESELRDPSSAPVADPVPANRPTPQPIARRRHPRAHRRPLARPDSQLESSRRHRLRSSRRPMLDVLHEAACPTCRDGNSRRRATGERNCRTRGAMMPRSIS